MENITVKDFIEILKTMNQDAVVCGVEVEKDKSTCLSIEACYEIRKTPYIDYYGNYMIGDVVVIS